MLKRVQSDIFEASSSFVHLQNFADDVLSSKMGNLQKQNILEIGAKYFSFHSNRSSPETLVCNESQLPFSATFDIVKSSLNLHLSKDPRGALQQMVAVLKPRGQLFLSCFGHHSLFEWRSIFLKDDIPCGLIDFINPGLLETWLPASGERHLTQEWVTLSFPKIEDFLHQLKSINLAKPKFGHPPLSFKTFQKACQDFNSAPSQKLSFQILFLIYTKPYILQDE
ncbi:Methyltransferase domain protein [Candidatus Bealeia paramacronuclearis]|uniref:Methyltransferase domain protein n=1 Tax=Candidatus Bealeia paramacronuclearis TaxID=1921001 RepID=A0ABZ2C275_9PROT|nr:Methyltransferase domain protein [Candidatus Bealeia paramacronuclearis]